MLDLRTLTRPNSPNHHLIAPAGFSAAPADEEAPRFPLPARRLFELAREVVRRQPRTAILEESAERMVLEARQRTPVLRFADDVTIQVVAIGESRSTLALYSRSRVGYADFGVNRRRARAWLKEIANNVEAAQEAS